MAARVRLIARLDVKGPNLIKGKQLEGLRVVGDPHAFARRYYEAGIDELIYLDAVASLYGRNNLTEVVRRTAEDVFIPITVGGGIRSVDDVTAMLRCGADKVAVNTAATRDPELVRRIAERFGSQCIVLSIEAKQRPDGSGWEAVTNNGRDRTGLDVVEWAQAGVALGAGEILLTGVDHEGMRKGFDLALVHAVASRVSVPVIASGGMGNVDHLVDVAVRGRADAVAIADLFHYERMTVGALRSAALAKGVDVRRDA